MVEKKKRVTTFAGEKKTISSQIKSEHVTTVRVQR